MMDQRRATIAFGPELPHFGSWQWIGTDLIRALSDDFATSAFRNAIPTADVVVIIKFLPPREILEQLRQHSRIVFCPVDVYENDLEIQHDAARLRLCQAIVTHAPSLVPHFQPHAPTIDLPHHVKFITDLQPDRLDAGPILWVGVKANIDPLLDWLKVHALPRELVILTDESDPNELRHLVERAGALHQVTMEPWTPETHLAWLDRCSAAFDIKGAGFRARHKPATKACDFLASGIPVALQPESSPARFLRSMGFEAASPTEDRWFSADYRRDTLRFGAALRELFSLPRVANRWKSLFHDLLAVPVRGAAV